MILRKFLTSGLTLAMATGALFAVTPPAAAAVQLIRSIGSGDRCLQLAAYTNGTRATLAACDVGQDNQVWDWQNDFTIRNVGSVNGCLDLSSYNLGTAPGLNACSGAVSSQRWRFEPDGTIRSLGALSDINASRCFDLGSYADGSPAILNTCNSALASQWWGP